MQRQEIKAVDDFLKKPTIDNPTKTYAQALIDGSLSDRELAQINSSSTFPSNHIGQIDANNVYSTKDAMEELVAKIGPHLSDKNLYLLVHRLVKIEVEGNLNTQAFRTSTLAKYFLKYETQRHSNSQNRVPISYLSHFNEFVLPLCRKHWHSNLSETLNTFSNFNLGQDIDCAQAILDFDPKMFRLEALNNVAPAGAATREFIERYKPTKSLFDSSKSLLFGDKEAEPEISKPQSFKVKTSETTGIFKPAGTQTQSNLKNKFASYKEQLDSISETYSHFLDRLLELQKFVAMTPLRTLNQEEQANLENKKIEMNKITVQLSKLEDLQKELASNLRKIEQALKPLEAKLDEMTPQNKPQP